jgi:predicted nucleotidyltransferase
MPRTLEIQEIIEKIQELKPELATRFRVKEIGLFGSWIRGEQRLGSDIDLLVDFQEGAELF